MTILYNIENKYIIMTFNNYNLYQKKYKGVSRNEKPKYNKNIDYSITIPPPLPTTQAQPLPTTPPPRTPEQEKMLWFKMHYFMVQNKIRKDYILSDLLNLFNNLKRNKRYIDNINMTFRELKELVLYYFDYVLECDIDLMLMLEFDLEEKECKIDKIIRKGEL